MFNPIKLYLRKRSIKDPVTWTIIGFLIFLMTVMCYLNGQGLGVITGLFGIGSAFAARWFIINPVYPEILEYSEPEEEYLETHSAPAIEEPFQAHPAKKNPWPSRRQQN